ncbi:unnamed protein product [Parnassius apollo]|uniref:Hemolin n=1 Tax=Parnassius apollo TaxID=110799 RepID=A0A8S3XB62_PARAO|nr:unnamed protein product [Parnassius apollo]
MGSNCCKGDAAGRPVKSSSSIYSRSRAGASLDDRFTTSEDASGIRLTVSAAQTGDSGIYTLQASNAAGKDSHRLRLEVSAEETPSGDDPPTFLRRLQDLTVKVGTRTRFLVEIVSSTECKVTWYRNERRLMEAERVALVRDGNFWCADVATVSVDDAGRWTCTAENAGGRASCSAHLNVLVPKAYKRPEFVEELRALLTEQGTVSLECKVVGVPTPVLRWFKDSREIKAGDVFALTANAEDPTSLGTYTCEAVNCMGRAYSSSKVHVIGRGSKDGTLRSSSGGVSPEPPPIFTKELQDQFVKICEPLTMSCHIVVPPWPRSVVWYNKEGKIEPSERYHVIEDGVGGYLLEVPSAEWPDEGEWKCVATSTGGRVGISTCYVTMDVPKNFRKPRFMENLQAVLTEEGLVSFECKVVGFPTPVLSWFKDGQELKPGDVYQLTGTNSLGSYCCIARNCMGQANSSAELTVEDIQNQLNEEEKLQLFSKNQAPKFLQGLKSVEAKIDEPFRFTVKVAIPPEPSVLWYRDDQPVDDSKRCYLGKEERGIFYLDIQTLEFLDQAEWKCVAMNDFGHSVTSCFLKLIIPRHYKKPRFLENLQAILSDEGAVNLECKVIGVPQPVLKWYKDGEELKPGDIHRIISGQDGTCCLGTYTCEAQNCMGIAASSASLLGFDDSMKMKGKKKTDEQPLQRNLSLSTIHEERTSQMYDTPVGDITLDDKGEISFSFDGKEVSVSLYETPDLTEEEALQIVEMYADQLSENITEHNVVELPPLRFVKETSTSGNLLMEAIIIDVSPEYFTTPEEDLRTEADIEDISIADENGPPQLSLDHELNEEGNLEKRNVLVSDEQVDDHQHLSRKKSDSQRSGDYFSFSHDHSLSDEKRDDDTQLLSESDLQSFASAHSSEKPKSFKPSPDEGPESSEVTKTTIYKGEIGKNYTDQESRKLKRERRSSCSSKTSSSGSEISHTKSKGQFLQKCESVSQSLSRHKDFEEKVIAIKSTLGIIKNDLQILEKDIILKSELMSSVATASKSLEIINSLLTPLSEIHTLTEAAIESINEINNENNNIFKTMPESLRSLQQSLTVIEKCIDIESENKTLVKKTCISLMEKCGDQMQNLMSKITSVTSNNCFKMEDKTLCDIQSLTYEINNILNFTADTIKTRKLLIEASELRVDELSSDVKHLKDTQKGIYELKRPVMSLLNIVENAEKCETGILTVNSSSVILADMSASIQDLQSALEQIESLSIKESATVITKYNTEIIDAVMNSVLKLRSSFEHLSLESKNIDDSLMLKQNLTLVKSNLNDIFSQLKLIENNIGCFDILQSENKLEALQKMAQVLIALENNLPRLEVIPNLKVSMNLFHKQLTRILENVIESNDAEKYFVLMEIWDALKRVNSSIYDIDSQSELCLASMSNSLKIIKDCVDRNLFESELNKSIITNMSDILICIQEVLNQAENESLNIKSEYIQQASEREFDKMKADIVMEQIDKTLAAIAVVTSHHALEEQGPLLPVIESICPLLEELKHSVACVGLSGIEREEHISEITENSSQATETLAKPLCELNRHISILNEIILENPESFSESIQQISAFAQPLNELYKSLETLQHNTISQIGYDLSPYDLNKNVANAVQNLYNTTLMIHENIGMEAVDEISTLEDISGIKTMAETNLSDVLLLPIVNKTKVQQSLEFMDKFKTSAAAQALHILNKHIIKIQNHEVMNTLEALSKKSQYSNLRSFVEGLSNLHAKIQENLSPIEINVSQDFINNTNTSTLVPIAELMLELQQCLSLVDTSNIPIFEDILDISPDTIHSVFQGITEFKTHLEASIQILLPALEIADKTVNISYHIETLKESCVLLSDLLISAKINSNTSLIAKNIESLEVDLVNFLHSFDILKGINVKNIKTIVEDIYENLLIIQEEIVPLISSETKEPEKFLLIQTLNDIEANIVILEQFNFVELSESLECRYSTPFNVIELKLEPLYQVEDIVVSTTDVLENLENKGKRDHLVEVEKFIRTCKSEFIILRSLITKQLTFKRIMRIYQKIYFLRNAITAFDANVSKFNLSYETKSSLLNFISKANTCLNSAQISLNKIFEFHTDIIYTTPLAILSDNSKYLSNTSEKNISSELADIIKTFLKVAEIVLPTIENVRINVINELSNFTETDANEKEILDEWDKFVKLTEQTSLTKSLGIEYNQKLENMLCCIQQYNYIKDAPGSGKQLILLMCMAECSQMLKQMKELKAHDFSRKTPLNEILTRMIISLKAFNKQMGDSEKSSILEINIINSMNLESTEPSFETLNVICEDLKHEIQIEAFAVTEVDKSLMSEICKEIELIQNNLQSLDEKRVKDMIKTLNTIGKSLNIILSSEKEENDKYILKANFEKLLNHLVQYIDLIENLQKIPEVIKIDNLVPSMNLAKELRTTFVKSISISEKVNDVNSLNDMVKNADKQIHSLQESLSMLQVQLLEHCSNATLNFEKDDFQHAMEVVSDLQKDLLVISAGQTIINISNNGIDNNELNKDTAIIDNLQARLFNDKAIKDKEISPILEGAVDEKFKNEFKLLVYKDSEVQPKMNNVQRDEINLGTQFDNGNTNTEYLQECEILSDKTHTQASETVITNLDKKENVDTSEKNTANVAIILGELVNHLEEFASCSDVVSRLVLLTNITHLEDCMKTAKALKEKITESLLSPENTVRNFFQKGYIDKNYASLPQDFYETLKFLQKQMHNKTKELSVEFGDVSLQRMNNVLTNLVLKIHAVFISEKTNFEELNNNRNFNITTASEFVVETFAKNIDEKLYSEKSVYDSKTSQETDIISSNASQQGLSTKEISDNMEKNCLKYISKLPICSEVLEQMESTQENLQQLQVELTQIVATSTVCNEENDLIVTKNLDSIFFYEDTLDQSFNDNNKKSLPSSTDIKQKDSLYRLKSLLQEVCNKIDILATVETADDIEILQNTLDEIQAVIIELKCDYDGSVSDAFNETLEDLECSVRSVQLQIHEGSPPELLKEACAALQLLVTNMCGLQELHLSHNMSTEIKLDNILQTCSNDTAAIVTLLDATLELKTSGPSEFSIFIADLNTLKCLIKTLKSNFDQKMETLIEMGIEINQNLDLVEDRVFTLEKDVDLNKNLSSNDRDTIITVIHSVYGSISNMRGAITSVQKQYMFENYGKPSTLFLNALKNIALIVQTTGESNWKKIAKSLRKVLNHFEDIKFYINFDKTARLPSDAAFTKIILFDLKSVITEVILANETQLSPEIIAIAKNTAVCLESRLLDIENQSHLEVKEKIPIFQSIAYQLHLLTESIKDYLIVNTSSQDKEGKTLNKNKTITKKRDINILDQDVPNTETTNTDLSEQSTIADPLKTKSLEENKEEYYECDTKNLSDLWNSEAETIKSKINVLENESNKSQNYSEINNENSIKLDTCLVNDSHENTKMYFGKLDTSIPNFALEIVPESVMSENILEQSLLKIEEPKPLEASPLHVVETRVLYEAQTAVAVSDQLIEFDQKAEAPYESDKLEICANKKNQLSTCNENEFTQNSDTVTDLVNNQSYKEKMEMMDSKRIIQQEYIPSDNTQVSVTIEVPCNKLAESKEILENNIRESALTLQSQTSLITQDNDKIENNENFEEDKEKKDLDQLGNDLVSENERVQLNKSEPQITFNEYQKRKSSDGQDILEKEEKEIQVKEMKSEERNLELELNKGDKQISEECDTMMHSEINANVMQTIDVLTNDIKIDSKSSESMNPSQDTIDQEKPDEGDRNVFRKSKENKKLKMVMEVKPESIKQLAKQSQDSSEINNFVQEQDKVITEITVDNHKSVHVHIDKNDDLTSNDIQSSDLCQGILNRERGKIQTNENNQNVLNIPEKHESLQEKEIKSDVKIQETKQSQSTIETNSNIEEQNKVHITIDVDTIKQVEINKNDLQSINDLATNQAIMQLEISQSIQSPKDDDETIIDKVTDKVVKEEKQNKVCETKILVTDQLQDAVEFNINLKEQNKENFDVTLDSDTSKDIEINKSKLQTNNGIGISETIIQVKRDKSNDRPVDTMDKKQNKIIVKDDAEIILDKSKIIEGKFKEKEIEHETRMQITGQSQLAIETSNIEEQYKVNPVITIDSETVKHIEINKNAMQSINELATNGSKMPLERSQSIEPCEDKVKQELYKRKSKDDGEVILDKSIVIEKVVKEEDKVYDTRILVLEQPQDTVEIVSNLIEPNNENIDVTVDSDTIKDIEINESESQPNYSIRISEEIIQVKRDQSHNLQNDTMDKKQDKRMLEDDVDIVLDKSKLIEEKIIEKEIEEESKLQVTGQPQVTIETDSNIEEQKKVNTEITIDSETVKHIEINKNATQSINELATNEAKMPLARSQSIEPCEDKIKQELDKTKSKNDDETILDKSIVIEKVIKEEDKVYETKVLVPEQLQETFEINSSIMEQNKENIDITLNSDTIRHVEINKCESQTNNAIAISSEIMQVKRNQTNDLPTDMMDQRQDKRMLKDDDEIALDKSKGIAENFKEKENETKIQAIGKSQITIETDNNIIEKNKESTNLTEDGDTLKYLEVNRNEVQSQNDLATSESIMQSKVIQSIDLSQGMIDQEQDIQDDNMTRKVKEDEYFNDKGIEEKSKEKVIEQKTVNGPIEHPQDIVVINNKTLDQNIENVGILNVETNKNVELLIDLSDLKTCESIQLKESQSSTAVSSENDIYNWTNEKEKTENILKNEIEEDTINKSYISEEMDSHKLLVKKEETEMLSKLKNSILSVNTTLHQKEIEKESTNINQQNDKIKTNDKHTDKVVTNTEKEKESEDKLLLEENEITNKFLINNTLKLSKQEQRQDNNKEVNYNKKEREEITKEGRESKAFESNNIKSDLETMNLQEVNKIASEGLIINKQKEKSDEEDKKDFQQNCLEKPVKMITKHKNQNMNEKKQDISKYETETKSQATGQSHILDILDQSKENTQMLDGNSLNKSQEKKCDTMELTNNVSIKEVSILEKELMKDTILVKELENKKSYFDSVGSEETYLNLQNEAISNMVQSIQLPQHDLNLQEIDKINETLGIKNTSPKFLTNLDELKEVQESPDQETIKSKSVNIENTDSDIDFEGGFQRDKSGDKTQLEDATSLFTDNNITELTEKHIANDHAENFRKVYGAEEKKLNKAYEVATEEKQGSTERQNSKIEVLNNTIKSKKCDKIQIFDKKQSSEEKVDLSEKKIKDQREKNAFRTETINDSSLNEPKIKPENVEEEINDHKDSIKELEKPLNDLINVSQNKQTEFNLDQYSRSNEFLSTMVECESKEKKVLIDRSKSASEPVCDYSMSVINMGQIQTFYKVETIAYDSQLRSSLPPSYENTKNNETAESNSKYNQKSKAQSEAPSITTQKRPLRDVKRKPVFSTHLTDRTAVEGSRVKLTCSVLASSEPIILWYKNGVPLNNKLKYRTKYIDGLITMEVLNAVPSDSAEYRCTVETENGSVTTCANLKVYPSFEASPIPPTFTRSIRDTYHLAENELILECRIRGQPLPTITWLKDDRPISLYERYQAYYLADGVCRLVINSPCPEDSGKFTCKAENSIWTDQISHIVNFSGLMQSGSNLTTWGKSRIDHQVIEGRRPHFTNVLTDYKVSKGGTIGLQVEIKGSPTRVEWLREGRSITEIYRNAETFVDHGLYTLALSDVTEKESGVYTCRAWSKNDKVDMNAAITVVQPNEIEGKPAVIIGRPQKDIVISVGADINISFRVNGEPKPKVTFMKGIRDITNSQRVCKMTSDDYVKFTLKRSVVSDAGTYCIFARNAYGCDRAFVTVAVRQRASSESLISDWTYPTDDSAMTVAKQRFKSVPNRIPGEPSVVDGGNNWVSLAWPKPDSQSGSSVIAYKVESWLLGKEGGARWTELGVTPLNSFDVFNIKQGEEYHFRVTPRNRYGWGESVQTTSPIGVGLAGDRPEFVDILPGQLKVLVGETVTLKCSFKGKPIPEIVWMKNGHEIDEEDSRLKTSLNGTNCCLTINDVRIEDEARYSCEATNVHGRSSTYARIAVITDRLIWEADAKLKRERSADVEIGEYPPQFTMRLRDRRVQATYPVRLTCQVVGRPPPIVTWFKDGEEVTNDARHTKFQDELFYTLEIAPTNLEDGGVYEATARNNSGAISCHCNLVVDKGIRAYVAPEFCCGLEPLYEVSVGDELRISAVVEAYPSVGVTWFRDGIRLRPSRRAVMTLDHDGQIELAVAPITQRDAGIYTCTASNEVGKASTSGKVEVLGNSTEERNQTIPTVICPNVPYSKEPMFTRKPRSSEAREGDTVIIECEVIGDPKPEVYWLRDFLRPDYYRDASHFKRVGAGPEYRFEIPHAKLDYTGTYSVVARNIYGEAKAIISLQILAKDPTSSEETHNIKYGRVEVIPCFEKELTDLLSHDGDAIEFECRVTGNPEPDIKWYHYTDIIRDNSDFETTYELGTARLKIKQVAADDEGTYTCEAYNSLGKAKSSACLVVYPPGEPNTLSQRLRRPPALLSTTSTPRSTPRSTPARSLSRNRTPGPDMRSLCSPAREVAPKFYTYPFNKVAEEGDTVVFQCAVKGLPAPWTTWDKDGVVITPSSRINIKEKDEILRILEIEEVTSEDVGLYRVTLENDYGEVGTPHFQDKTDRENSPKGHRSPPAAESISYLRYKKGKSRPRKSNVCLFYSVYLYEFYVTMIYLSRLHIFNRCLILLLGPQSIEILKNNMKR